MNPTEVKRSIDQLNLIIKGLKSGRYEPIEGKLEFGSDPISFDGFAVKRVDNGLRTLTFIYIDKNAEQNNNPRLPSAR